MANGFLYVLINPAMPGLAKVGKTTRNPSNRVSELSAATGVPSPFILAYQQPVQDCHAAEVWVHAELERNGYRVATNREFFKAPLHEITALLSRVASIVSELDSGPDAVTSEPSNLVEELLELAEEYLQGTSTHLPSPPRALALYEQAAALGSNAACMSAAVLCWHGGEGVKKDLQKAITFYKKAHAHGSWLCLADLAQIFSEAGQPAIAKQYWHEFFASAHDRLFKPVRGRADGIRQVLSLAACKAVTYQLALGTAAGFIDDLQLLPFAEDMIQHTRDLEELGLEGPEFDSLRTKLKEMISRLGIWDKEGARIARVSLMSGFHPGNVVAGIVTATSSSWIEVDVEGISGIIFGDEVAEERPVDSRDMLYIGQRIDVKILKVHSSDAQLVLSLKQALPNQLMEI